MRGWRVRIALAALLWSTTAAADPYDLRLFRLGNPTLGSAGYSPDADARFRVMALELAGALNASSLMPPGSLGISGFAVGLELGVASIGSSVVMPTESTFGSPLLVPAVHIRKGLPFSFELGGKVSWIEKSRMMGATLELRWAFLEGFIHLPDVSVRGYVTELVNGRELNLTTGGLDFTVGKRFPVAGSVNFIPYGGYTLAWVAASSTTVDFDPARDENTALASPIAGLTNTGTFRPLLPGRNTTHRVYAGVRFSAGVFRLGLEGSLTFFGNVDIGTVSQVIPILPAFSSTIGLSF